MIQYTNHKLLLTEYNIHECIDRLLHEFAHKNVNLELSEAQDIFSRTLAFENWEQFSTIIKQQSELLQFSIDYHSLSTLDQNNLLDNFIQLNDITNLQKLIHFKFSPGHFYTGNQSDLVEILKKISNTNSEFQESFVSCIKDYLVKESNNLNDVIHALFALQISTTLLDNIIHIYSFDTTQLQTGLVHACENNNINFVKHLLLNYSNVNIDDVFFIKDCNLPFNPLCCAIRLGHVEIATFLLTSSELKKNANINIQNSESLFIACQKGNLNLVKFLLTSNELTTKSDMYAKNSRCLITAFGKEHTEIVHFLLYDMHMQVSPRFYETIENKHDYIFFNDNSKANNLTHMIEKRDLYFQLNKKLQHKSETGLNRAKI